MAQTVADVLVRVLEQIGVKHIFGLIGDSLNPLADAIRRSHIEWIGVRHEEGAALAAAGQAKLTGRTATVRPSGPLRVNNGDAMMPALIAGTGLGILPEFILSDALAAGRLGRLVPDWSLPTGAVYWVTPPGGPRPKRLKVLGDFLAEKLSPRTARGTLAAPASTP